LSDSWESGHARIEGLQFNSAAGDYELFATEDEPLLLLATNKRRKPADNCQTSQKVFGDSAIFDACLSGNRIYD
jgi:hypothetical protein